MEAGTGLIIPRWFVGILSTILILMGGAIVSLLIFQAETKANRFTVGDAHAMEVRWQASVSKMQAENARKFEQLKDMIHSLDRSLPVLQEMKAELKTLGRKLDEHILTHREK